MEHRHTLYRIISQFLLSEVRKVLPNIYISKSNGSKLIIFMFCQTIVLYLLVENVISLLFYYPIYELANKPLIKPINISQPLVQCMRT